MANSNPQQAAADAPDLTPETGDTITLTRDELAAMVTESVATAVAELAPARQGARPTAAAKRQVPVNHHPAPSEPTWEPPFIPTPDDYAAANAAADKGQLVDEPIPVAGTIIAVDPDGEEHVVTPKAFRNIYAAKGWKAHPEDAARGLAGHGVTRRRRRGGGNIVGTDEGAESTASNRRRRQRRPDSD